MRTLLPRSTPFALLLATAACGGGGSSARVVAEAVALALEGPALTDGDATSLHGATDRRAAIVALAAGGVAASSADGFATFSIDVPLAAGDNAFAVESTDDRGRRRVLPAPTIRRETPLLYGCIGAATIATSATTSAIATVCINPDQLLLVDPATGERTLVSGLTRGAGPPLFFSFDVSPLDGGKALLVINGIGDWSIVDLKTGDRTPLTTSSFTAFDAVEDPPRDRIAWVDLALGEVRAIDPDTLVETLVSDGGDGNGPAMTTPLRIEYDPNGDRFVVLDLALPGLLAVDPDDGSRKLLSDFGDAAQGPLLPAPNRLVIDGGRKLAWSIDSATGDLIEIALSNGRRRVALAGDPALGPSIAAATGIAVLDDDTLVAAVGEGLVDVDLSARTRRELGRSRVGGGPDLAHGAFQLRPVLDRRGERLLFADPDGGVQAIALRTGDRSVVMDGNDPAAPFRAGDLFLDDASGRLFALSQDRTTVAELDRRSFAADVISSPAVGAGLALDGGLSLAVDLANGRAFVVNTFSPSRVVAIDLATGDRASLAHQGDGGAIALQSPIDVAYDPRLDRVLVTDLSVDGLLLIDPATGDRSLFAQHAAGGVPRMEPVRFFLDPADHAIYGLAHDGGFIPNTVVRVDLDDGERTLVSGSGVGRGPALHRIDEVAGDAANGRLWLFDSNFRGMVQVDAASGDRLIVSR